HAIAYQSGSARVASSGAVRSYRPQVTHCPTARISPVTAPPSTAPRQPATTLPNSPAAPPTKNSMIMGGARVNQPAPANTPRQHRNTAVEATNPTMTAVGATGNTVGASSAGRVPGMTRSLSPLNAGTISARNIRTPNSRIAMPPANRSPTSSAHTQGDSFSSISAAASRTTPSSANATAASM